MHRETVRFRDLDGMGHVNNAVFSTYLEQARLAIDAFGAITEALGPRLGSHGRHPPITPLIVSETKLTATTSVAIARAGNTVSHQ